VRISGFFFARLKNSKPQAIEKPGVFCICAWVKQSPKPSGHTRVLQSLLETKKRLKSLKSMGLSDNLAHEKLFINRPLERW